MYGATVTCGNQWCTSFGTFSRPVVHPSSALANMSAASATSSVLVTGVDDDENAPVVSSTFNTSFTDNYVAFAGYAARNASSSAQSYA